MNPSPSNNTAILIFANSSEEELQQKRIPKSEQLFKSLTGNVLNKVKRTTIPYFHFTEKEQIGTNFGERFVHAIQSVFDKGFENIITIGNDTPQLQTSHLLKAQDALKKGKTVLGPSLDGGFYLMGIQKSHFKAETFKRLPWQQFSLFHKISDIFTNNDRALLKLPKLGDIDNLNDVKRLSGFKALISTSVLSLLTLLLPFQKQIIRTLQQDFLTVFLQKPFNKGSPQILL